MYRDGFRAFSHTVATRLTRDSDLRIFVPMLTDQIEQNRRTGWM
jgi:hypothetical protein